MVPLGFAGQHSRNQRPAGADALQQVSGRRRSTAPAGPGVSSRDAIAIDGASWPMPSLPSVDGVRMDRDGVSGTDGRQHGDDHLRFGRGDGVSGAGGAIRKLVDAAGGDSGRADVPAERDDRRAHGEDGYQHFHADRFCRAGRAGEQERDSDCRICQAEARVRRIAAAEPRWKPAGCGCGRS